MGFNKLDKRPAGPASLKARDALQSLEEKLIAPIIKGITRGFLAIINPLADYIDQSESQDIYKLMLTEQYPTTPNWHEDSCSKSKEPFNPHNSQEGCAGEVFFLKKYKEKAPELFKELMQIRIQYFEKLKKK